MNNYIKLNIKDYDNFHEIIEMNEKINKLKTVISENKNLVFELNNEESKNDNEIHNNIQNNLKKRKLEHVTFYVKIDENIHSKLRKELDDNKCSICYELLSSKKIKELICDHHLCFDCYCQWNKICLNKFKLANCPTCRKIIM